MSTKPSYTTGVNGSWRNEEADKTVRFQLIHNIVSILQSRPTAMAPDKLPSVAKRMEDELYRRASSLEEYMDPVTLKTRLKHLAITLAQKKEDGGEGSSEYPVDGGGVVTNTTTTTSTGDSAPYQSHNSMVQLQSSAVGGVVNTTAPSSVVTVSTSVVPAPAPAPAPPTITGSTTTVPVPSSATPGTAAVGTATPTSNTAPSSSAMALTPAQQQQNIIKQRTMLFWMKHASKCEYTDGNCPTLAGCARMKTLWQHIIQCNQPKCEVPHCLSNRHVLSHYQICKNPQCPVCAPVRESRIHSVAHDRPSAEGTEPPAKRIKAESAPRRSRPLPDISHLSEGSSLIYSMTKSEIRAHIRGLRLSTPFFTPQKLKAKLSDPLRNLMEHENGWIFNKPVDPIQFGIPDYFEIIKEPMDLGTISKKLAQGLYLTPEEFYKDVKLTFDNAMLYNPPDTEVHVLAGDLLKSFNMEYARVHQVFKAEIARQLSEDELGCNDEETCNVCRGETFTFDPQVFYCNGRCKHKIRRNAYYYSDETNKLHFCTNCFAELPNVSTVEGIACHRKKLRKGKNDATDEEPWVQCDTPGCEEWTHQICALFNGRRNESADLKYICPKCILFHLEHTKSEGPLVAPRQRARNLPVTHFSKFVEDRCKAVILKDRELKAKTQHKPLEEIPLVPEIFVRVVSAIDVVAKVKPLFSKMFRPSSYPKEFPYRSKAIVLFQELDGVETLIFAMYVQEYGDDCPEPNNRSVYISYLDSVKYFSPSEVRTLVFQEIVVSYLHYVKLRGFLRCYIWACPPMKGDDYILYAHPEDQKTPKSDRLRKWYTGLIEETMKDNVVMELSNLYDEHMNVAREGEEMLEATRIPYMDGDYWPGVAEDIIAEIEKEDRKEKNGKSASGAGLLKSLKRAMQAPGPFKKRIRAKPMNSVSGGGKSSDPDSEDYEPVPKSPLMRRICDVIEPMKEDFLVCKFFHSCRGCGSFITNGVLFESKGVKDPKKGTMVYHRLCNSCYNREISLPIPERYSPLDYTRKCFTPITTTTAVPDDTTIACEFFNTRQSYLELCQGNHYQYDFLRRAKHSTMMTLYHLHNPSEPSFIHSCNICSVEIKTGFRYHCDKCPDFDICGACHISQGHEHTLVAISVTGSSASAAHHNTSRPGGYNNAYVGMQKTPEEIQQERKRQIDAHMHLLSHAAQCSDPECVNIVNCTKMKQLLQHGLDCEVTVKNGCKLCARVWGLLKVHAVNCRDTTCRVPRCFEMRQSILTQRAQILAQQPEGLVKASSGSI